MDLGAWEHCGYRSNAVTTPVSRDDPNWYVEHAKHIEMSKSSIFGHVLLIGDDFFEAFAHYPRVWNHYFGTLKALNYGLKGDRTQHVLWRVETGAVPIKAETIIIHAGAHNLTQDHSRDIANGIGCIALMCHKHKPNARILLTGIIPFDPVRKKKITNVNRYLKLLCSSGYIPNCFFVKPDKDWLNENGTINHIYYANGLTELGMGKFAQPIHKLVINSDNEDEVKMSSDSEISTDDDVIITNGPDLSRVPDISSLKHHLKDQGRPLYKSQYENLYRWHQTVSGKRSISRSKSSRSPSPSRSRSRSRRSIRSRESDRSRRRYSSDRRTHSKSRSPSNSSDSRPVSPVFTRGRSRSLSRSPCRSRSRSTSHDAERKRWCKRAQEQISDGETKASEPFELMDTWSASAPSSPSSSKGKSKEPTKVAPVDRKESVRDLAHINTAVKSNSDAKSASREDAKDLAVKSEPVEQSIEPDVNSIETQEYDKFMKEIGS